MERALLGGRRKYTRAEVADRAGVPSERSARLWRALGFATVADDEVVFTDADVEAMRVTDRLVRSGLVEDTVESSVARALGQHLSRLAEWQIDLLRTLIVENPGLASSERRIARLVEELLPELEAVQTFVWRRHLAAFAGRAFADGDSDTDARVRVAGFVDMVGFTRLTRRIDDAELRAVLERFEGMAGEVIAEQHGRVVKMIGDEVLFVADSAAGAAEIALTLSERADADEGLPAVRAGLASGPILSRFGDVYGSVVNLASRLTSIARPGTILVDRALAAELAEHLDYRLRLRRPVSVRGYNRLRPSALRRAGDRPGGFLAGSQELAAGVLGRTPHGRAPGPPLDGEPGEHTPDGRGRPGGVRSRRRRRR
ncbi:adenylate/guanylate cyclase domain-containing protein [Amycolatopsis antarctica]|uniref:Adenylate/guanylate cyclase domain-containing protein n=1 Tax=Amycolatopsis antarctica TaxID=1854586 RepID=A0A263D6U0_9PSEU|nr:adenylate/guanylate cyclase domain-containing protein [Amycolatopsis antarctica]